MRIVVATTVVPFVRGGDRVLTDGLVTALAERGHDVDLLTLPFWGHPQSMPEQMAGLRTYDLADTCDTLICMRTPSYLLRHPDKRVWFIHHHRGAHDLWGTPYADIRDSRRGRRLRDAIRHAEHVGLAEASMVRANSKTLADRLLRFNGIEAPVLRVPLSDPSRFTGPAASPQTSAPYVLCPGRISGLKRQWLFAEAMRHVKSRTRLVIAGQPDNEDARRQIEAAVAACPGRVELIARWLAPHEHVALHAGALAIGHAPFDEDAHTFVNLEALAAGKPLITVTDAGGALEVVDHELNGLVCPPTPRAVAAAMDRLAEPGLAERFGERGRATFEEFQQTWTWDRIVGDLLA
ncbi:MAG: hypothetical protein AVDCRST_MAG85-591 [uncultured Solirubrobacteraceae bacterium]|uniref:Uncharacterized protein n=1 Tax=uncultured Solirubrobacteraceae bacterium TaxID=1162706 RepID=A0A6J4RX82_9ACTN|nr:MAG: hypothetical protein AVDCRST_MAG85-591 [uncultured Solirubrobacteraceae bacterium]